MNEPEDGEYSRWWIEIALGDLATADKIMQNARLPPRVAASLAHQAAEKAIKAAIALGGDEPPRTHSLRTLVRRTPVGLALDTLSVDLDALTAASGASRYPDPHESAYTSAEVERLIEGARATVAAVIEHLGAAGVDVSRLEPQ